ncbi:gluconate 2-dehydrogenase [Spongiactinospora gelatinilytica]|uniref:Gluconate 2-dehydrogenase n=1 Tax=Spongiactinospora gelatinilytica TaxID=2666298 RepID=A0A2W2GFF1_9ACTN|nr:gluconate 2-dehydrogenase subunit 3 family protein [Spongiactinospora gelatinilytica]PZG46683.1 gluconate 2-dehydrogenase [Spongiactinospora gelatinilytica]
MSAEPDESGDGRPSRRALLSTAGGVVAGGAIGVGGVATGGSALAEHRPGPPRPKVLDDPPPPLRALTDAEAAAVTAMAERVFPSEPDGDGAAEAGVTHYIDGRLAGAWGDGDRMYLRGPFFEPEHAGHGYQLPLTPREVYERALRAIDAHCKAKYAGRAFPALTTAQQDEVMTALEKGQVDLGLATGAHGFTSASFFAMFLRNVTEGLFCDPMHDGNRDMVGWLWLGFPGDPLAYGDRYGGLIGRWNEPYNVYPKGVR